MSETGEYVPSPRPNPRLRPEGAAYAERNRGTMERWFDYTEAMGDGADKEVKHSARNSQEPAQQTNSHGGVQEVTESCSNLSLSNDSPQHRVASAEAKEYAERNRGQMDHIINNYGVGNVPEQPASSSQSQNNVNKSQNAQSEPQPPPETNRSPVKQRTMHQESQGKTWEEMRPAQRIRPDGESIAMKNSADSMFGIMRNDNLPQSSPTKVKSSRHSQESVAPVQSANAPRARPGEGMRNYERAHNQSEMAAIMRGESNDGRSSAPRNVRHLQRSELW